MSVTDWLNKGRSIMSNDLPAPRTDAEFLADVAISALQGGRYELARELTRLAAQAKHMEMTAQPRMVPMGRQTREEQPGAGPTGNGDEDLAATAQIEAPASARCATEMASGAYLEHCRQPIFWKPGSVGDQDHPAVIAGWYHVNPVLDHDHQPTAAH